MKLDTKRLAEVIAYAKQMSAGKPRLIRGIDRAAALLREGHFEYDNATGTLTVMGSGLNRYVATPTSCQCKAFTEFKDGCCRHRIAVRLLRLYHDAVGEVVTALVTAASRPEQDATAPVIVPTTHEHFCTICGVCWDHSDDDCGQGRELVCLECFKGETADRPAETVEAIVEMARVRRRVCAICYTDVFEAQRCLSHKQAPVITLTPELADELREKRFLSDELARLSQKASRKLEEDDRNNSVLIKRPIKPAVKMGGYSI